MAVRASSQHGGQFSKVGRLKVHSAILACARKITCRQSKGQSLAKKVGLYQCQIAYLFLSVNTASKE